MPHSGIRSWKMSVETAWADIPEDTIAPVCFRVRPGMEQMVAEGGDHLEK